MAPDLVESQDHEPNQRPPAPPLIHCFPESLHSLLAQCVASPAPRHHETGTEVHISSHYDGMTPIDPYMASLLMTPSRHIPLSSQPI